jgi:hypothetical protein
MKGTTEQIGLKQRLTCFIHKQQPRLAISHMHPEKFRQFGANIHLPVCVLGLGCLNVALPTGLVNRDRAAICGKVLQFKAERI